MIERIIEFSIRRRAVVFVAAALLAIWGARAAYRTPVDAIPDLSENQVIVFTDWQGHGPREIEDQVTYPLALRLQGLAGVRVVRSSSNVGFSMISVIFQDAVGWGEARRRVGEAVAGSERDLPLGITPRLAPDADATGQIFWYTVESAGADIGRLRALQDWFIKPQLASVDGVAEVASVGGAPAEYQIQLDPHRLKAFGVSASDVAAAVAAANAGTGGDVIHKGNAEYIVRAAGRLGSKPEADVVDPQQILRDLAIIPITGAAGAKIQLSNVATITIGPQPRRGVLEKDGNEVTGGVVLMRHGENPREVTRRIRAKIEEIEPGLPPGTSIMPFYDRTPLVDGAVGAVTRTLIEAIVVAAICIFLVLLHFRTSFIIALTLPLSVLASFGLMEVMRSLGIANVQTNIMSLAGLAISIGVLVDSSIVMAENAMHHLKARFGDRPATGDTRELILPACRTVGRPIFFSVVIMLLSFLPVFALTGLEGKMFHPLAFTKSFALLAMGLLAITLVPALCTVFVKGRLRSEEQVALVRSLTRVYRPVLRYFIDRPAGLVWFVCMTFVVASAPIGMRWLLLVLLVVGIVASVSLTRTTGNKIAAAATLIIAALLAEQRMTPLGREFMVPIDEGMVMDMPVTVPRASVTQSADDLKARDMILCRFPEVDMVVGKAGRAETSTDPAPLDMIETMVNFRPLEFWPKRCLRPADTRRQTRAILDALIDRRIVHSPDDLAAFADESAMDAVALYDAQMREAAYQRNREFDRYLGGELARFTAKRLIETLIAKGVLSANVTSQPNQGSLAGHAEHLAMEPSHEAVAAVAREVIRSLSERGLLDPTADPLQLRPNWLERGMWSVKETVGGRAPTLLDRLQAEVQNRFNDLWASHVRKMNSDLLERAPGLYTRLAAEAILNRATVTDEEVEKAMARWRSVREGASTAAHHHIGGDHRDMGGSMPEVDPVPVLDSLVTEQSERFARGLLLWPRDRAELTSPGGELDRAVQMPGWTNVWTMPIQNRVDMLSTGVNTTIGVRVLGRRLDDVVKASEEIAALLKTLPGAIDVIADPVRGKGYVEIHPNREKLAELGINPGAVSELVEIATGGKVVTTTIEGRERHAVRVGYARDFREDEKSLRDLPVMAARAGGFFHVPLGAVADVRITGGPATINGENGLLRNYVRLNVRGRDASEFVDAARQAVLARIQLPPGVFVEWTGHFEEDARSSRTIWLVVIPLVAALIFTILWWTYRDLADAVLMLLAFPGAVAGGVLFQWLFGFPFSAPVRIGYIACLGMATSTAIIMLVYLREAVDKSGGLAKMSLDQLREAVLNGAVHRLRPKLLTEAVTILGLAPLLWAGGPGADVLRPMVIPVLGGILMADEVIDLLLPVLFYHVRRFRWQKIHAQNGST